MFIAKQRFGNRIGRKRKRIGREETGLEGR